MMPSIEPLGNDVANTLSHTMHFGVRLPEIEFDHIRPKDENGNGYTPKQIGAFAWAMYGLLIFSNVTFYSDLGYRMFVVGDKARIGAAGQTMWGAVNFMRIVVHYIVWLLAGFAWCYTFISSPSAFIMFGYITYGLAFMELLRVFLVIIGDCIAFIYDGIWSYERIYRIHPDHFSHDAPAGLTERVNPAKGMVDAIWLDLELETLNIAIQFLAFPLF